MTTENLLTALGEFSSETDIPVSLIRHSSRRTTSRNQATSRTNTKVIPMMAAQAVACSA